MLEKLLPRLEKVHRAQTRKELEAIYRFRYTIYAEELGREIGGVDHKNRMVRDAEDDKDYSIHLYVGTPDEIMGVLRVRFWKPGGIPDYDMSALSLNLFPDIDKLAVAEMGRLMVKRTMRGCFILPSLALETYHILVGEKNVDFVFLYCRPGLVRHYRRLGARPYVGDLVSAPEGMEVPMVVVPFDEKYFKKIGSPLRPLVKKYYGPGKRHPIDLDPYQHLFDDDLLPVEFETEKVWEQFEQEFIREQGKAAALSFLNALPRKHLKKLTDKGFIMQVAAGTLITREEHVEKEMFIILDGIFEVFMRERRVGILEKGDLFGEVAFFRASGKRSATVKALTTGRLLVLRRKFLKEMAKRDPDTAFNILFNLGSMLSERFVAIRSLIVQRHHYLVSSIVSFIGQIWITHMIFVYQSMGVPGTTIITLGQFIQIPLAIGDALGEIISSLWGKQNIRVIGIGKINKKSKMGTGAVFLGSLLPLAAIVLLGGLSLPWVGLVVVIAVVSPIVEIAAPRSTDNFCIPVMNTLVCLVFAQFWLQSA